MATSIFINGNEHALSSGLSVSLPTGSIPLKPITQAEYDALSEEEKNSETAWLVTDAESGGESSVAGGGSSDEVYSEEETVIGTWFGKPLYRKVFQVTTPTDDEIHTYDTGILNGSLCRYEGFVFYSNGALVSSVPCLNFALEGKLIAYANANCVRFNIRTTSTYQGHKFVFILEYTKTTDV